MSKISLKPGIIVRGGITLPAETQKVIDRHKGASYTGENTAVVFRPGEYPPKPAKSEIIANRGQEWYDEHKETNIQIVGQTYTDRDSGRIVSEIFSEDEGRTRVLAEEL